MTPANANLSASSLPRKWCWLLLWFCLLAAPHRAIADDADDLESRIKAAFIYKFADYVDWPIAALREPNSVIVIGVMNADTVATELGQLSAAHPLGSHTVQIRRLNPGDSVAGIHILFLGQALGERLPQVLQACRAQPVLTVTESEGALALGSVINFVTVDEHIRFNISLDSAQRNGLKLSSRLLGVALHISGGGS